MADQAPFYGTLSIDQQALENQAFAGVWQEALKTFDQSVQEWGITTVTSVEPEAGVTVYSITGRTDEGWDESVDTILAGALDPDQTKMLYAAIETLGLAIGFDITEYLEQEDTEDALSHETGAIKVVKGTPVLDGAKYEDIPVTSAKLVELGFAEESEMDDEELAVMVASSMPEGPKADDIIDAITDLRNDPKHGGVFTAAETSDPQTFIEELEGSYWDEMDDESGDED